MGTVTLTHLLSVISLLHITYGNPVNCSSKITKIPNDFLQNISHLDLVAKSSSHRDKILIRQRPRSNSYAYSLPIGTGGIKLSAFKMDEGFLLLEIKTAEMTNLYLARMPQLLNWPDTITNPSVDTIVIKTATKAAVDKFQEQATCFGTKYNYFLRDAEVVSRGEGEESCSDLEEKQTPLSIKKSLGRWNVVVSAHSKIFIALHDTSAIHSAVEIHQENHEYYMSILAILANYPVLVKMPLEEQDGYLSYKGSDKAIFRHFSKDCAVFASESLGDSLFLCCRTAIHSSEAMSKFAQCALHLNHTFIFFRREPASSCLDIPPVVTSPNLQKLSGKWKVVGSAMFISEEHSPTEIEFTVEGEHVILSSYKGFKTTWEKRFDGFYDIKDGEKIFKVHESPENSLLLWIGSKREGRAALYLLSKHFIVEPNQKEKFKLFASCLSLPNINVE
ncbi:uncharacterized protein [Aquarana catesbeiana]|uniref:uncharacterized protein isoform X2 n=1 Tax=Aquarana catesbeiana TaxID=8400 RepID=UPI003CC942FF